MKVTLKFDNILSSVEGTESEIMDVLRAMGIIRRPKPVIPWYAPTIPTVACNASAVATLQEMKFTYRPGDTRWRAPNTEHRAPVYDSAAWTGRR